MSKKISVKDIAEYLGINQMAVRVRMKNGTLPIGIVTKGKRCDNYLILPNLAYEVIGYKAEGYEPPVKMDINCDELAKSIANVIAETLSKPDKQEAI